jgi:uncharacterized protein (TIGR02117 family)
MRKSLLFIGKFLLFFLTLAGIYLLFAVVGTLLPASSEVDSSPKQIPVFVASNGFHTALILPLENKNFDWLAKMDTTIATQYTSYKYISLGWGDRGFFMGYIDNQSPTLLTSLKALFLPTPSLMHVTFYQYEIPTDEHTVKLLINKKQLEKMIDFVKASFEYSEEKKWVFYHNGYGQKDYFFASEDDYHLFNTCNVWTNEALKQSNLPASWWSPFAQGVMWRIGR